MVKIAITTTSFAEEDRKPLELLKRNDFKLKVNPYGRVLKREETIRLCRDVSGVIAGSEELDASILEKLVKLKVISRCGAGLDNVDITAARKLEIKIYNTPDAPVQAVAELTVGLILNLLRKVSRMEYSIRRGEWKKLTGSLLYGKRIGIIGFGRIGRRTAELLSSFGCRLAYSDPFVKDKVCGLSRLSLKQLLKQSDIISLHASGRNCILKEEEFKFFKKGGWLINVSRGQLVDEEALYSSLKEGRLAGAALDVYKREPYTGALLQLDNVILTPHIGSYARESRIRMELEAVKNLLKGLKIS